MTLPPTEPRPHSIAPWRSRPRNAAPDPAARPVAVPASASCPASATSPSAAWQFPSRNTSIIEVLRRPLESALTAGVRVTDEAVERRMSPGPCGHVQGVDHQSGGHRAGGLPSDEAPRVDVDDEGHVDDPRPRRAVGEVGHPQGVGARGREVSIDEVRRPHGGGVGLGGEPLLRPARPPDAVGVHEPCHLVPTGTDAGPGGGLGELAASVDRVVVLPELGESRSELWNPNYSVYGRRKLTKA